MELHEMIENTKSKEDFILFLKKLEKNYLCNNSEWENTTIDAYIESISRWLEDYGKGDINWEQPQWSTIALLFYIGKIYE